ncbi:hypothetical protein JYU14_04385 [Simkania negevensis]|uniref:Uncharacterized protein n=1 Tax=Simkania negevensis TaxID=83561 RepID=A0ABS3AT32_9BACT|nr:hypothetical protein [Simkania negevensis]
MMAYREVCCKASSQTVDSQHQKIAGDFRSKLINNTVKDLFRRYGIRRDLAFVEAPCAGFCKSEGTNRFYGGAATISVAPGLFAVDEDAVDWLVMRQIFIIKDGDRFNFWLVKATAAVATVIFNLHNAPDSSSLLFNVLLIIAVEFVAGAVFYLQREIETDAFVILNASDETLQGGERFLSAFRNCCLGQASQNDSVAFFGKHSWVNYGSFTLQGRIARIQGELARRRVSNDPGKEHKIKRLEAFLIE